SRPPAWPCVSNQTCADKTRVPAPQFRSVFCGVVETGRAAQIPTKSPFQESSGSIAVVFEKRQENALVRFEFSRIICDGICLPTSKNSGRCFSMTLPFVAALVLGLMCGSELNVAAFAHPTLDRQPLAVHIPVRSSFAVQLGRVMPFWMVGSTLLNLLLLFRFERLNTVSWRLAAIALAIQVAAVVFSLVGPVPINNRIAKWTPESLPN